MRTLKVFLLEIAKNEKDFFMNELGPSFVFFVLQVKTCGFLILNNQVAMNNNLTIC